MIHKERTKECERCGTLCELRIRDGKEYLICPYCERIKRGYDKEEGN